MNKYLKTALVFFYLQFVFLPFIYLIGSAVFQSAYWPLNEWAEIEKDGKTIVFSVLVMLEGLYLYLSIKY